MDNFKNKIIYQIWTRSFCDGNGDGIGDIQGIISKLEYLSDLHIDYIWLAPIYPAEEDNDAGILDYCNVHPDYGTLKDFRTLVYEAKRYHIGIILNLNLAHTYVEHEWFQNALSDFNSPYRDYYFFRDGKKGFMSSKIKNPPNNWSNAQRKSAWQREDDSDQYYLSTLDPDYCDLNWENPDLRREFHQIMEFWLKMGIAGFHFGMVNMIAKAPGLPRTSGGSSSFPYEHTLSLPISHEYLQEMSEKVLIRYDSLVLGDGITLTTSDLALYTAPNRRELNIMYPFNGQLPGLEPYGKIDFRHFHRFSILQLKKVLEHWQMETEQSHGWIANYISNHERPFSERLSGNYREYAKAFGLLNFMLRGTPFIYQGAEIGMISGKIDEQERMSFCWTSSDHEQCSVDAELRRDGSIISFYQRLAQLRKEQQVLNYGNFIPMYSKHKSIMSFIRSFEDERILIFINLSSRSAALDLGDFIHETQDASLLLHTHPPKELTQMLRLRPYEGLVYKL